MLSQIVLGAIGLAVGFGAFAWAWRSGAYRWRRLAAVYGTTREPLGEPVARRRMQNLILRGGGLAWNAHNGITTVAVHETGLSFSLMFPFSVDHPPFFIPFADMTATQQDWYLNTESYEIGVRRDGDIKLVVDEGLMQWIEAAAGHRWTAGSSLLRRVHEIHEAGGGEEP